MIEIDTESFKSVLSQFATGVTVVTAEDDGEKFGLTVNAFASVSLSPMLILICLEHDARTNKILMDGHGFTVNILSKSQKSVSQNFATPGLSMNERFNDVEYRSTDTGGPVFVNSPAWLECRQRENHVAGDHRIYIGSVEDGEVSGNIDPLIYYDGDYQALEE